MHYCCCYYCFFTISSLYFLKFIHLFGYPSRKCVIKCSVLVCCAHFCSPLQSWAYSEDHMIVAWVVLTSEMIKIESTVWNVELWCLSLTDIRLIDHQWMLYSLKDWRKLVVSHVAAGQHFVALWMRWLAWVFAFSVPDMSGIIALALVTSLLVTVV